MMPAHTTGNRGPIFEDIVIRFTRQIYYEDEATFQLEVRQSPAPLPGGAFSAEIAADIQQLHHQLTQRIKVAQFFNRFDDPNIETNATQTIRDLGRQLYALLPPSFQQAFPQLVQSILEQGKAIRLILEVQAGDKADRLLGLPWELLFFNNTEAFLTHSPRVAIVRRLLGAIRRSPARIQPPFNILHIIAHSPAAGRAYQIDPALQDAEHITIRQATRPGQYHRVAAPGSVEQMVAALQAQAYHIVHFLGHGEIHRTGNPALPERGYIRFINHDDGTAQWVTGEQLQYWLEFSPTVQLVVLNACHGGANVARSIAVDLVYHGLPYVVAIQGDFLQEAAQHFAKAFYTELQRGSSIEYAVAVGRAAIATHLPATIDWCLPMFYTNTGLPEKSATRQFLDRLWHWMSAPNAQQYLGIGNLVAGSLHLAVGGLLLLSEKSFPLPAHEGFEEITTILVALPFLLTAAFFRYTPPAIPEDWPLPAKAALGIRTLVTAAIGTGLPNLYTWFTLLLLTGMGLWNTLTSKAHTILLGLLFIPGIIWASCIGYAQMLGHSRAFLSDAKITIPGIDGKELLVLISFLILSLVPGIVLHAAPGYLAPPWGNLLIGGILSATGYALWHQTPPGDRNHK